MSFKFCFLLVITVGFVGLFAGARQDPPAAQPGDVRPGDLNERVEQLESRIAILEKLLFSSVRLEKNRAQRLLNDRKNRLKNSRALYAQGMITEFELQQDRMQVDEAQQELELAIAESRQNQLASELDLLEAERKLKVAADQLTYRRNMARRGYASKAEVQQLEQALDQAKLELENAKLKLESAKKLESLDK